MCRWAAYIGRPIFLEDVITAPGRSLLVQSLQAEQAKTETHGDGCGVAWYDARPEPGLYRDVLPAWSDANLRALAHQVRSGLFLAHVRAATAAETSRVNCHPFVVGRWSFMHNGQVGGYERFRRDVDMGIAPELYPQRRGATDSEALFLLALGDGLDIDPKGALERAAGRLEALSRATGEKPHLRMSVALSNGERLFAARYASDAAAPSLYHRWSDSRGGRAVVSEPLEQDEQGWDEIPPGSFASISPNGVTITPFAPRL